MIENKILNNGISIPAIGFGVYTLSGLECVEAVEEAIKAGYRHIDTAESYENESEVGYAINECIAQGIVKREDLFITTKLSAHHDNGYENTIKYFEYSLNRLGLDYVDLYLIHFPNLFPDDRWKLHNADTWRAMEYLVEQGKIKSIGVSNFMVHHIEELKKTAKIMPSVNQIELSPQWQQRELVKYCEQNNIQLVAWGPLARKKLMEKPVVKSLSDKYKKEPAQILLRWSIQKGFIPLVKSVNKDRIKNNICIEDFELNFQEMSELDDFNSNPASLDGTPDSIYNTWSLYEQIGTSDFVSKLKVLLFGFLPLFVYKRINNKKEKIYLFGFIPFLKLIKQNTKYKKVYLFNIFPLFKVKAYHDLKHNIHYVPQRDYEENKKSNKKKQKAFWINAVLERINSAVNEYSEGKIYKHYKLYLKLRRFFTGKNVLPTLDVHITTSCTLRCKDCGHYIPYFTKENRHNMSFEEFKDGLDKILKNVDFINNLLLLGGEPLLNKDLAKMAEYADKKKQIKHIKIITNGTIIPDEQLINTVKKLKKVAFSITNYSKNKEIKSLKTDKIISILKKNNIKYYDIKDYMWGRTPILDLSGQNGSQDSLTKCYSSRCIMWSNGKVYHCPAAEYLEILANQANSDGGGVEWYPDEIIDLNKYNLSAIDFNNFLEKTESKICKYCDMTNYGKQIFPAIQIK